MPIVKDDQGGEHDITMLYNGDWKDGKLVIGFCSTHREIQIYFRSQLINFDYKAPVDPSPLPWLEQVEIMADECNIICEQLYIKGSEQSWMQYQQDLKDGNVETKFTIQ